MQNKRQKGHEQEIRARAYLESQGYEILEMNRFYPWGEIDLIAHAPWSAEEQTSSLVFVEVRSATEGNWIDPCESITAGKKRRLVRAIESYLLQYSGPATSIRIDLIACTGKAIRHYPHFIAKDL